MRLKAVHLFGNAIPHPFQFTANQVEVLFLMPQFAEKWETHDLVLRLAGGFALRAHVLADFGRLCKRELRSHYGCTSLFLLVQICQYSIS